MNPDERTEWLAWRRRGIGASDVASAASGRYGGLVKVVADKLGRLQDDEIDPRLAERGHRWEPMIADGVHGHTGLFVAGEQLRLENHSDPRWRCTPDGLLLPTPTGTIADAVSGLEIKTRGLAAPWAWDYWTTQSQWSCLVAGLPRWLIAVGTIVDVFDPIAKRTTEQLSGVTYRWVYADKRAQTLLVRLAEKILQYVKAEEIPEPDTGAALDTIRDLNQHRASDYEAPDIDDLADLLERYDDLKEAAKAAADELAQAEAQIRHRMGAAPEAGPAEALTTDGRWRIRIGQPVRKMTSWAEERFIEDVCMHNDECGPDCTEHRPDLLEAKLYRDLAKDEEPDLYDAYKVATNDRRMTIKKLKE